MKPKRRQMRIVLICVGRLKAGLERELFARYIKRLVEAARSVGIAGVDLREVDESRARRPEDRREEESALIIAAAPSGAGLIVLDERGDSPTSEKWADDIRRARDTAQPFYVVVIGGPDGLAASLRAKARRVVSFGAMTWPHQLARVMASEQLYRAISILSGHPYHRA
jgi:23S rRNA (pseudouridine1915-N3)-methyltransferase